MNTETGHKIYQVKHSLITPHSCAEKEGTKSQNIINRHSHQLRITNSTNSTKKFREYNYRTEVGHLQSNPRCGQ